MSASRWRGFAWLAAILCAMGLTVRWLGGTGGPGVAGYLTAPVERGTIEQTVTATGTVNPVKIVQVGTYVSGPILALDVDFNSPVQKGQRVAKIDAAPFTVKVRQAEAALANARAKVDKSRADLALKTRQHERNRALVAGNLIAQSELDITRSNTEQAAAQLALDQAAVQQAQAGLDEAQVNLRYTDILSPVDGVVVARNVDVGQTVAASFQTPTLFLIAEDLTKMQVNTNVSESDVGRVHEGQPATFTVDAYPGLPFRGVVQQVRNAPVTVQNVVTYDVVIAVDNPGQELKPGMTATVTIVTARRDDVLMVPARALRFRPEGTAAPTRASADDTVYVLDGDGAPTAVHVGIGIRDGRQAELLDGSLVAEQEVVVGIRRDPATSAPPASPALGGPRRF